MGFISLSFRSYPIGEYLGPDWREREKSGIIGSPQLKSRFWERSGMWGSLWVRVFGQLGRGMREKKIGESAGHYDSTTDPLRRKREETG